MGKGSLFGFLKTVKCEESLILMEEEASNHGVEEGNVLVKIHVPELDIQKCLQFPKDQLVWNIKEQCLAALPQELKEGFNYGLFSPPENGRAGKFLDEERRLGDYPFNSPVGYLELKYKRRVYKTLSLDEKQLKNLHTRANFKRLIDYVQNAQVEKITKMCSKGLDPNFQCQDSGETPLTLATTIKDPAKVLIALVNGGALLDYRTRDGTTAMHRAVEHHNLEAMRTLLELGASPNYKDAKGLTPLYLSITCNADPQFTEVLLHDHAISGAQDLHGWSEIHQACKKSMLVHLEHLLLYGADMNAKNASGNTPLHVCAVNNQTSCARTLLLRGADREALNYANQTPYQVAIIAQNMELAEIIQNFKDEHIVHYRGPPSYNPKRRSGIGWLHRVPSLTAIMLPPSPCPSDRSCAPFSSTSSSISEGSTTTTHQDQVDNASIITEKSCGDSSDIISDSSGIGTANSDTTSCSTYLIGSTVVCVEPYHSPNRKDCNGYVIKRGDILEVTGTRDGYLEGHIRNSRSGGKVTFPAYCVQEVKLRCNNNSRAPKQDKIPPPPSSTSTSTSTGTSSIGTGTSGTGTGTGPISHHFATAPRLRKPPAPGTLLEPRTVVLHKGRKGFGFILRGAKASSPLMELTPSEKCPALQYLDDVDPGGVADMAGLRKGDFLLKINNEDVSSASHERVVDLIRKSGDLVQMSVISVGMPVGTVPAPLVNKSNSVDGKMENPARHYSTLPRKNSDGVVMTRSINAPIPPRRDPKTTLSVGRARAKSLVSSMSSEKDGDEITKSSSAESVHNNNSPLENSQPRTASIKQRPTSHRITPSELEKLFQTHRDKEDLDSIKCGSLMSSSRFQSGNGSPQAVSFPTSPVHGGKIYSSVSEMKRGKKTSRGKMKALFSTGNQNIHKNFHSTPDLAVESDQCPVAKGHRSQDDLPLFTNRILPPPSHPPPPPPQVITVDVYRQQNREPGGNVYGKESGGGNAGAGVASSFRPSANAKLFASPEDSKSVAFRSKSLPYASRLHKSQSMRSEIVSNYSTSKYSSSTGTATGTAAGSNNRNTNNCNLYAQPYRPGSNQSALDAQMKRPKSIACGVGVGVGKKQENEPPIPEPDYSCSDSESENGQRDALASRLGANHIQSGENSGNSNTSGSSGRSSSIEEVQKNKVVLLKSSKSYPEGLLKTQCECDNEVLEDGDNSSSGVSSDQENPMTGGVDYVERRSSLDSNGGKSNSSKPARSTSGSQPRHAISMMHLPPPIDENEEKEEFYLPPPPEFDETAAAAAASLNSVGEAFLAPPPQFSDSSRSGRVKVIEAVAKYVPPGSNRSDSMSRKQPGKLNPHRLQY